MRVDRRRVVLIGVWYSEWPCLPSSTRLFCCTAIIVTISGVLLLVNFVTRPDLCLQQRYLFVVRRLGRVVAGTVDFVAQLRIMYEA